MKLEKFNLQDALNGRPVVTRNGNHVKIAGHNPKISTPRERVVGWDDEGALSWCEDGSFTLRDESGLDLFHPAEEKQPRTFWVNEYKTGFGPLHDSVEGAINGRIGTSVEVSANYITTHKITIP